MGAFYNSLCIRQGRPAAVRDLLVPWFQTLGFELAEGPVLFDLDGETERSVFVVSNDDWALLFYSHYDEERRWIRQLQNLSQPLLYVWVHDSDVWGYDLFDEHGFTGSFSSDPREHISFSEDPLGSDQRPAADLVAACRSLGIAGQEDELTRIQNARPAFKEDACREFCQLIGAQAAVASYDDLESGNSEGLDNWQVKQLLFVRQSHITATAEVDLHGHESRERHAIPNLASEIINVPKDLLVEMQRQRRRALLTFRLLKPISRLAAGWRALRRGMGGANPPSATPTSPVAQAPPPSSDRRLEGRVLVNERHGCRITLAEGIVPIEGSSKPSAVFSVRVDSIHLTCTARHLWKIKEVLRQPSGSKVRADEKFTVADLLARHLLFELPPRFVAGTSETSFLSLYVIQTGHALYVFLYRYSGEIEEGVQGKIRRIVESFTLS